MNLHDVEEQSIGDIAWHERYFPFNQIVFGGFGVKSREVKGLPG